LKVKEGVLLRKEENLPDLTKIIPF
jgi:hypothetical protein